MSLPRLKEFTARRNEGLTHATLETIQISELYAELIRHERTLGFDGTWYDAQGDFTALIRCAPCEILVSFQSYKDGSNVAVFRIKDS